MMVKFSQHGMPAMPVSAPLAQSRLVRRLLQAQGDPVKQRVLAWLLDVDDARLRTFGSPVKTPPSYGHSHDDRSPQLLPHQLYRSPPAQIAQASRTGFTDCSSREQSAND
jgi:hypothetical protein